MPEPSCVTEIRSLRARLRAAMELVDRYQLALEDIAEHGCRHDTTPTVVVENPGVQWWYSYIQSMDKSVRDRAKAAL